MKNILQEELYRIKEVMGIEKPILNEQSKILNYLTDVISDFINVSKRAIPNVTDEVQIGNVRVPKTILDEIEEVLAGTKSIDELSVDGQKVFGKIVAQNPQLVDDVYREVVSTLMGNNKTEKQVIEQFKNFVDDGENLYDVVVRLITEPGEAPDDFAASILSNKIYRQIRAINDKTFRTTISSGIDDVTKIYRSKSREILSKIFGENEEELNALKNRIKISLDKLKDSESLSDTEIADYQKMVKSDMDRLFYNGEKITNEFLNKLKVDAQNNVPGSSNWLRQLEDIKAQYGDWGVLIKVDGKNAKWFEFTEALKSAITLERNIFLKLRKLMNPIESLAKSFKNWWVDSADEIVEKTKKSKPTSFSKYFVFGSPRGIPRKLKFDKANPYEDIYKISGMFGARRSYVQELLIRMVRIHIYLSVLETLYVAFTSWKDTYFKTFTQTENNCINELSKWISLRNLEGSEVERILDEMTLDLPNIPKCFKETLESNNVDKISKMVLLSSYRANPGEGTKILSQFVNNLIELEWGDVLTKSPFPIMNIPGFINEYIIPLTSFLDTGEEKYIEKIKSDIEKLKNESKTTTNEFNKVVDDSTKEVQTQVDSLMSQTQTQISGITLTVDKIYEKYPCYLTYQGKQISDLNFGDKGIEIVDNNNFKYKFADSADIYEVQIKPDGYYWNNTTTKLGC